jgi:hypothetical protein
MRRLLLFILLLHLCYDSSSYIFLDPCFIGGKLNNCFLRPAQILKPATKVFVSHWMCYAEANRQEKPMLMITAPSKYGMYQLQYFMFVLSDQLIQIRRLDLDRYSGQDVLAFLRAWGLENKLAIKKQTWKRPAIDLLQLEPHDLARLFSPIRVAKGQDLHNLLRVRNV